MSLAPRFESLSRFDQYKVSNQLGYYLGPDKYQPSTKLSFPKAQRFKPFNKYDLNSMMPGPSDYNPNGTIKHTVVMRPASDLRKYPTSLNVQV